MRILLVNTHHFRGGGDSTYTFNLADLLRSQGHEVAFFAMQDARNLPDANADLFVSNIDFREANRRKNITNGLRILGRVIYSKEARSKFGQLLNRFKPDIVHLQGIHHHISPSIIFEARQRGLPVVWTLHDYKLICPNTHFLIDKTSQICEACGKRAYYQPIVKRCKKGSLFVSGIASLEAYAHWLLNIRNRVDAFFAPSQFLRKKLLDRGFMASKVHLLPNFLPADKFNPSVTDGTYFLFLGKLEPIKGVYPLLQAFARAPEAELVLAGSVDGILEQTLHQLIPTNARYVGLKHGVELQNLISGAQAVILPSLWYENQPYSILEAFGFQKPVIASDLGGMIELIGKNQRGILVKPGDIDGLRDALVWFKMHPKDAQAMGARAYQYAHNMHSAEKHYMDLMSVYTAVMKG